MNTAISVKIRVNHKVFMPWGIRYRYIRTSSRDRTNSKFSILISDRRILEHLMMDRVFANIFTGYPKIFDIHIQICILCIVVIPTNCVPAYLIHLLLYLYLKVPQLGKVSVIQVSDSNFHCFRLNIYSQWQWNVECATPMTEFIEN